MWIRRQSASAHFTAEMIELLLREAALEERGGVDARRGVALEEHLVAESAVGLSPKEVIEPHFVQCGRRRVRREVSAEPVESVVRTIDHHHGVPANERPDSPLDELVAGEPRLLLGRDRIDVVGLHHQRHADALVAARSMSRASK